MILTRLLIPTILCLIASTVLSAYATASSSSALASSAAASSNGTVYRFNSCIDGNEDYYALIPGKALAKGIDQSGVLIVYLHSLSGDLNEPFKLDGEYSLASTITKEFPAVSFLSFNNGKLPSWGNAAARIDITNSLRLVINELNIKKIVLIGNSMGAVTALTYAATAPSDIKQKITGVVAISPCADLEDLYKQSTDQKVKPSLEASFGVGASESPVKYEQNSLNQYLAFIPPSIKFSIISATADTVVPILLQQDVVRDLNNRNLNVKSFEIEGKSDPLSRKRVLESMHFVME